MESQKNWAEKVRHIREGLIEGYPNFKPELDAHPNRLEKILGSLDLEFHWKRPHKGKLSLEQQQEVRRILYPQVKRFSKQIELIKIEDRLDEKKDCKTKFQAAAQDFLKKNWERYPDIKDSYLENDELFNCAKAQLRRDLCRNLLLIMIGDNYNVEVTRNYIGELVKKRT
jgi:DNA polymerase III delta prime subunit